MFFDGTLTRLRLFHYLQPDTFSIQAALIAISGQVVALYRMRVTYILSINSAVFKFCCMLSTKSFKYNMSPSLKGNESRCLKFGSR